MYNCIHCDAEVSEADVYEARDIAQHELFDVVDSQELVDMFCNRVLSDDFFIYGTEYDNFGVEGNPYGQDDMEVVCVACMREVVDKFIHS